MLTLQEPTLDRRKTWVQNLGQRRVSSNIRLLAPEHTSQYPHNGNRSVSKNVSSRTTISLMVHSLFLISRGTGRG